MGRSTLILFMPATSDNLYNKYFPETFSIETPRVLLTPIDAIASSNIKFEITDKDSKTICGTVSYANIFFEEKKVDIQAQWFDEESIDNGLIKHVNFGLLCYAF